MVLVAYAGPESPAAALRQDSVLYLPTDLHALLVNKRSSSFIIIKRSSSFSLSHSLRYSSEDSVPGAMDRISGAPEILES